MLLCLLAGFGAGYWVATRRAAPAGTTAADRAPAPGTSGGTDVEIAEQRPAVNASPPIGGPADRPTSEPRSVPDSMRRGRDQVRPPPSAQAGGGSTRARAETAAGEPAPAVSRAGRMLVRSTPADAEVLVNGEVRGRTPIALRNLPYGVYRVTVSRLGYVPVEREVTVSATAPAAALQLELQRAGTADASSPPARSAASPQVGLEEARAADTSVEVVSRPAGARVFIDDQAVGSTPLRVSGLAPGPHTIRLEQPGYRSWIGTVTVTAGRLARVSASLDPTPHP
jgi:hypothetical protein